jgi:hypothetical protein
VIQTDVKVQDLHRSKKRLSLKGKGLSVAVMLLPISHQFESHPGVYSVQRKQWKTFRIETPT